MGRTRDGDRRRVGGGGSLTSFPSPSSSSSSDFEFTVSHSPTSRPSAPADELFYKGQLLPLHLSPRISMVRTLLLASSSTSSSSDATASRDSNSSSSSSSSFASELLLLAPAAAADCDSSRPSSATDDDGRPHRRPNYFSSFATRFSSVFLHRNKKDLNLIVHDPAPPPPKKPSVFKKYVKKVKPLYEKLSQKSPVAAAAPPPPDAPPPPKKHFSFSIRKRDDDGGSGGGGGGGGRIGIYSHSHSFSGNLRYPRRKKCAGSCPSSMRSSPSHSGLLYGGGAADAPAALSTAATSSMEELQSAIQGAIAHCKSTMISNHKK